MPSLSLTFRMTMNFRQSVHPLREDSISIASFVRASVSSGNRSRSSLRFPAPKPIAAPIAVLARGGVDG